MRQCIYRVSVASRLVSVRSKLEKTTFICYCTPSSCPVFPEFSDFLTDLALSTDEVTLVGVFNMYVDVDYNFLSTAFN